MNEQGEFEKIEGEYIGEGVNSLKRILSKLEAMEPLTFYMHDAMNLPSRPIKAEPLQTELPQEDNVPSLNISIETSNGSHFTASVNKDNQVVLGLVQGKELTGPVPEALITKLQEYFGKDVDYSGLKQEKIKYNTAESNFLREFDLTELTTGSDIKKPLK